jgi:crotonobetainyl-CoA:carnitine CoA-transferase CaiB-like acyl-CoA transferase
MTDPEPDANPGPLAGIRVLDVATMLAGPMTCQLLGDFGAEVIKIEHPSAGDPLRGHGTQVSGQGLWSKIAGRNKANVGLYLGDPDGAEIFLRLAATADIVVEGFRPGTLERWGLGFDRLRAVNPGIILVRVTGFGQSGPYASRAGFGTLAEAMSGFAAMTGEPDGPPTLPPFGLADGIAGITGAYAAMLALYHRDARSGQGQEIDLAIYEPLVAVLGAAPTVYHQTGQLPARTGNRSASNAPRNTYLTADGKWVAVSTSALTVSERTMKLVGHPEVTAEPWFGTGAGRVRHVEELDAIVGDWIAARSRDEVMAAFAEVGAAVAPVYDAADLIGDPHVRARGTFGYVEDADLGPVLMPDVIARLSATPGRVRSAGGAIGADTDRILISELGMSPDTVAGLRARKVVA